MNLIFLDCETTGTDRENCALVSVGAVHYETGENFYRECWVPPTALIQSQALEINGCKEEDIRSHDRHYSHDVYSDFEEWALRFGEKPILAGQNVAAFDAIFLLRAKNGTMFSYDWVFGRRFVDLHSIFYFVFQESGNLDYILEKLGLGIEPRPHNALTGATMAAAAYRELKKIIARS